MSAMSITVPSFTSLRSYQVHLYDRTCSCPDFRHRHTPCKHMKYVKDMANTICNENIVPIPSYRSPKLWYNVDLVEKTCTCPHFHFNRIPCKHVKDVEYLQTSEEVMVPIPTEDGQWHEVNLDRGICSCGELDCEHVQCARDLQDMFENSETVDLSEASSVHAQQDEDDDDGEPEVNSYSSNYDSDASDQTWVPGLE